MEEKTSLGESKKPKLKETTIMYSGGLDSTATVLLLSEMFDRVHLLTYDNGYGQFFIDWSKRHNKNFNRIIGKDKYVHTITSCKELFSKLVVGNLGKNYKAYKSRFIWCMGCKLAMHTHSIIYSLEHGIDTASDGSSPETDYYVEQMSLSLKRIRQFYGEYGINFSTPIHDVKTREEEKKLLESKGMKKVGIKVMDRNPGTQPLCVPGNFIYFASTFFKMHPKYSEETVEKFINEKLPIAREFIKEYFDKKGMDLEKLAKSLKEKD
jgi:hypothetical protein